MSEAAEGIEVYPDPAYYDMWAVRPEGETDFNRTLHFTTEHEAIHASHVIAYWMRDARLGERWRY